MANDLNIGDVLYNPSEAGADLLAPKITTTIAFLNLQLELICPYFTVSPTHWETIYEVAPYETINHKIIGKVRGYRPYWLVKVNAAGRNYMENYIALVNMEKQKMDLHFTLGSEPTLIRTRFQPVGGPSRPFVPVNLEFQNKFEPSWFADKYRGYIFQFVIRGTEIYPTMKLPSITTYWDDTGSWLDGMVGLIR